MKVTVKETKEVEFARFRGEAYYASIIKYEVYVDDILTETFYNNEADVDKYIEFLKEKKNDYTKVIKEIEI
jgi:hypothetical protein